MSGSGKRKIYSAVLIILAVSAVLITITSVVPAIKNLTELTPEQKKDTYITAQFQFDKKNAEGIIGSYGIAWLNTDKVPEKLFYYREEAGRKNWYYYEW